MTRCPPYHKTVRARAVINVPRAFMLMPSFYRANRDCTSRTRRFPSSVRSEFCTESLMVSHQRHLPRKCAEKIGGVLHSGARRAPRYRVVQHGAEQEGTNAVATRARGIS